MQQTKTKLKPNTFKAKIFKALADPVRLNIIELLRDGERCVCEIVPMVGAIQPVVSRHLKILKSCGIVKERKAGNRRLYSVTNPRIFKVIDALTAELVESLSESMLEQLV